MSDTLESQAVYHSSMYYEEEVGGKPRDGRNLSVQCLRAMISRAVHLPISNNFTML